MQQVHVNSRTQQQPVPTSYAPVHNASVFAQQPRQKMLSPIYLPCGSKAKHTARV